MFGEIAKRQLIFGRKIKCNGVGLAVGLSPRRRNKGMNWVPVLSSLLIYSPVLIASFVGVVIGALIYVKQPGRPQRIGLIGFVLLAMAKIAAFVGTGVLSQFPRLFIKVRPFYFIGIEFLAGIGLICVVYSFWILARGK